MIGSHPIWVGPDRAGARPARRDARRASPTGSSRDCDSPRSGSRSPSTRCCVDHDRLLGVRRLGAALDASRSRWRRGSCRCSSGTRATCAWRFAAATSSWAAPRLLSPLLAGSLERGLNLAEAMEARGYGRSRAHACAAARLESGSTGRARRCCCARRRGGRVAVAVVDVSASPTARPRPRSRICSLEIGRRRARRSCSGRRAPASRRSCVRSRGSCPHFHGGVFAGSVVVGGVDTREARAGSSSPALSRRSSRTPRTRS